MRAGPACSHSAIGGATRVSNTVRLLPTPPRAAVGLQDRRVGDTARPCARQPGEIVGVESGLRHVK